MLSNIQFILARITGEKVSGDNSNDLEAVFHTFYNIFGDGLPGYKVFPVYAVFKVVSVESWNENVVDKV